MRSCLGERDVDGEENIGTANRGGWRNGAGDREGWIRLCNEGNELGDRVSVGRCSSSEGLVRMKDKYLVVDDWWSGFIGTLLCMLRVYQGQ